MLITQSMSVSQASLVVIYWVALSLAICGVCDFIKEVTK
jgi:hypothetical protein